MTLHSVIREIQSRDKDLKKESYLSLDKHGTTVSKNVRIAIDTILDGATAVDLTEELLSMLSDFFPFLEESEWHIGSMYREDFESMYPGYHGSPDNTGEENSTGIIDLMNQRGVEDITTIFMDKLAQGITSSLPPHPYVLDITGATAFLTDEQKAKNGLLDCAEAIFFSEDDMIQGRRDDTGIVMYRKQPVKRLNLTLRITTEEVVSKMFGLVQALFDVTEDMKEMALGHAEIVSGILHHAGVHVTRGKLVLPRLRITESESMRYVGLNPFLGINSSLDGVLYFGDVGYKQIPVAASPIIASILYYEVQKNPEEDTKTYLDVTTRLLKTSIPKQN